MTRPRTLPVEDLPPQPRQLVEAGHGADRVDALRRQHLGKPLPRGEAPLPRIGDGVDAEEVDPAQQEGDHRGFEPAPPGQADRGHRGAVVHLRQHAAQCGAPHRIDAAGPAGAFRAAFRSPRRGRTAE